MKKLSLLFAMLITLFSSQQLFANTTFPLFLTRVNGQVLTIIPSIPNHLYPYAGIKINTPGYTLTNKGVECTLAGNGYCLFAVSSNNPKSISISGPSGLANISLCLNGKGPLSCQRENISISTLALAYAYITNANSTVTQCVIDAITGSLGPCTDSGATNLSGVGKGIALLPNRTVAYIVNGSTSNQVTQCQIDANSGALIACSDSQATGFDRATGIIVDPEGRFAYILWRDATINQSKLLKCTINPSTAALNVCVDSGATGLGSLTYGPAINFEGTFIYVSNTNNNRVSVCSVDKPTGNLGPCVYSLSIGGIIKKIALNPTATYAYVLLANGNTINKCTVDTQTGALSACIDSQAPATGSASSIAINAQGSFAYIMNSSTIITQCSIDQTTGNLTACVNSGATEINNSLGEMSGF